MASLFLTCNLCLALVNPASWQLRNDTLLQRASSRMAIGHDGGAVFLIGGNTNPTQALKYNISADSFLHVSVSPIDIDVGSIYGSPMFYAQSGSILFIAREEVDKENTLMTYNMSSNLFDTTSAPISLPDLKHICMSSSKGLLVIIDTDFERESVQLLNLSTGVSTTLTPVPGSRFSFTCALTDSGSIYAIGGDNEATISKLQIDDTSGSQQWETLRGITFNYGGLRAMSSVVYGDSLYVFGGYYWAEGMYSDDVYILNITTDTMQTHSGELPLKIKDMASTVVSGTIYAFGGVTENGQETDMWMTYELPTSEPTQHPTPLPIIPTTAPTTSTALPSTASPTVAPTTRDDITESPSAPRSPEPTSVSQPPSTAPTFPSDASPSSSPSLSVPTFPSSVPVVDTPSPSQSGEQGVQTTGTPTTTSAPTTSKTDDEQQSLEGGDGWIDQNYTLAIIFIISLGICIIAMWACICTCLYRKRKEALDRDQQNLAAVQQPQQPRHQDSHEPKSVPSVSLQQMPARGLNASPFALPSAGQTRGGPSPMALPAGSTATPGEGARPTTGQTRTGRAALVMVSDHEQDDDAQSEEDDDDDMDIITDDIMIDAGNTARTKGYEEEKADEYVTDAGPSYDRDEVELEMEVDEEEKAVEDHVTAGGIVAAHQVYISSIGGDDDDLLQAAQQVDDDEDSDDMVMSGMPTAGL